MNQQLIFNNDFRLTDSKEAVSCSVLQAGLRIVVNIRMPEGWEPQVWLTQIKEDGFFWEEQIEEALAADQLSSDGVLYLYPKSLKIRIGDERARPQEHS